LRPARRFAPGAAGQWAGRSAPIRPPEECFIATQEAEHAEGSKDGSDEEGDGEDTDVEDLPPLCDSEGDGNNSSNHPSGASPGGGPRTGASPGGGAAGASPAGQSPSTGAAPGKGADAELAFAWVFGPLREDAAAKLLGILDDSLVEDIRQEFADARARAFAADPEAAALKAAGRKPLRRSQQVRNSLAARVAIGISYNDHKAEAMERGEKRYVKTFVTNTFTCKYSLQIAKRVRDCGILAESERADFTGHHGQASRRKAR